MPRIGTAGDGRGPNAAPGPTASPTMTASPPAARHGWAYWPAGPTTPGNRCGAVRAARRSSSAGRTAASAPTARKPRSSGTSRRTGRSRSGAVTAAGGAGRPTATTSAFRPGRRPHGRPHGDASGPATAWSRRPGRPGLTYRKMIADPTPMGCPNRGRTPPVRMKASRRSSANKPISVSPSSAPRSTDGRHPDRRRRLTLYHQPQHPGPTGSRFLAGAEANAGREQGVKRGTVSKWCCQLWGTWRTFQRCQ